MTLRDELYAIESRRWTEGADAYRQCLDEDCLVAFTEEMVGEITRDEVVASVEGAAIVDKRGHLVYGPWAKCQDSKGL